MSRTRVTCPPNRVIASVLIALAATAAAGQAGAAAGPSASAPVGHAATATKKPVPEAPAEQIDINSASRAQLKTLPGIGDAEANRIIAARPYLSKAELVSKNVLATGPYLSIKKRIVAVQKSPPTAKR
jgi:competence protein ComEA